MFMFDFIKFTKRQKTWSWHTFGPPRESTRPGEGYVGQGVLTDCVGGVIDHLRKEISEVANAENAGERRFEWVDIIFLAMDGYARDGGTPMGLALDLGQKQRINEQRKWPDWRAAEPGRAAEHVRGPSEVFPAGLRDPHEFVGEGKRCEVCYGLPEDENHDTRGQNQDFGDPPTQTC